MGTSLESTNNYLNKVYSRYSEVRPNHPAPTTVSDLVAGKDHVFRKFFHPMLPVQKDAPILDIGCGYGEFLYYLQRTGYTNTQGIDLNREQVEVGRSLGGLNIQCGDSRKFLVETERHFDFISAIDVLEHIPKGQVLEFMELVRKVLSPGGTFLCQVPNLAAFYTPLFYMDFSHETPFTATSLKQALQIAGFNNVQVFPMGPVTHGAKSIIRSLMWKGISTGLRFIQTVEGGPRDPLDSIYTAAIYAVAQKHEGAV